MAQQALPRCGVVARASDADGVSSTGDSTGDAEYGGELSETVLERLQKAEKEAADLRYQLSLAKDMQVRCSQMHARSCHTWSCAGSGAVMALPIWCSVSSAVRTL